MVSVKIYFDYLSFITGTAIAVFTVVILIGKFCVFEFAIDKNEWTGEKTAEYIELFVGYFIIGVTVLVVAVPEGLPLAVTLALAYSVRVCSIGCYSNPSSLMD